MKLNRISAEIAFGVFALSTGIIATWAVAPDPFASVREQLRAAGIAAPAPVVETRAGTFELLMINTISKNTHQEEPGQVLAKIETLTREFIEKH